MNRPDELIKELENFSATEYGNELSTTECHTIADYIKNLETALDKACEVMTNRVNIDRGDGYPTLHFTKEEWKGWCMLDDNR